MNYPHTILDCSKKFASDPDLPQVVTAQTFHVDHMVP